jgi:acyl carrier protein
VSTVATSIEDRVKAILADQFCVVASEVDLAANLGEKYKGDSLDQVEIVLCAEHEFGVEVPDEVMFSITTGQQLVDAITGQVMP